VSPRLDARRWQLYLADWGYNTPEERQAAAALPGVRVISLPEFCELLRWGIVMQASRACARCDARTADPETSRPCLT
jgi:hypothetical protein